MRRLLPILVLMSACTGPAVLEVCGDMADNDRDGAFDEGCPGVSDGEICSNLIDDDGDGIVDCDDADCFTQPFCAVEECDDGFDNDLDDLVDCADPDCRDLAECTGGVRWTVYGDAVISQDRTRYTGRKVLEVEVADADAGRYEVGDILCQTEWTHTGTNAASDCVGCEWAIFLATGTQQEQVGPECEYWRGFTNPESGQYFGVGSFPGGLGYHDSYTTGNGPTFPAIMFTYSAVFGGWYALPSRTDFEWDRETGEFSWSLLWAYDYYH